MNWYKQAFPMSEQTLMDRDPMSGYVGIGHHKRPELTRGRLDNYKNIVEEVIWAVDYNYQVTAVTVTHKNKKEDHRTLGLEDPNQFAAKGRCETEKDEKTGEMNRSCSYVPLYRLKEGRMTPQTEEYMKKNIINALDQYFGNPIIHE